MKHNFLNTNSTSIASVSGLNKYQQIKRQIDDWIDFYLPNNKYITVVWSNKLNKYLIYSNSHIDLKSGRRNKQEIFSNSPIRTALNSWLTPTSTQQLPVTVISRQR